MSALWTLPNAVALCALLAISAYGVFGGADFGGGVWDFLARGPRAKEQRELIANAMGPIWEANHVWLILVVVILFVCFPPAFASLMIALHIPISLMLAGIVMRGSAFAFRTYDTRGDAFQARWGRICAIASVITPVLLGICVGTVASGSLHPPAANDGPWQRYLAPWLAPFPMACGAFALVLFALLAAVYLTVEAEDRELQEDFRRHALQASGATFVTAFVTLAVARNTAPSLHTGLTTVGWPMLLFVGTGVAAIVTIWALWARRYRLARIAAPAQLCLILWGWAAAQFPDLIPGWHSIAGSAAPSVTLRLTLIGLGGGLVLLTPSLWYLFHIFAHHERS
jgi:cytochrome bd ubiquinol oxidase subunit II